MLQIFLGFIIQHTTSQNNSDNRKMMLQHISNHGYIMQFLFLHHTRKDLFHRESKRCKANNDDEIRECSAKQGIVVISAMQWYTNQASSCIGGIC